MKGLDRGVRVGGCAVPFNHCRFFCQIMPLQTADPGRPDTFGNWMHLRYTGNIIQAFPSSTDPTQSDFAPSKIDVEFDADGALTLPYAGNLDVVGGLGDYLVNISQAEHPSIAREEHGISGRPGFHPETAPVGYQPSIRPLRRKVDGDFRIPPWHTRVWGYNSTITLLEIATATVLQVSTVEPGTRTQPNILYNAPSPTIVVTAWIG